MIALKFQPTSLSPDTEVKVKMANKQMKAVLERLQVAPLYHTLTVSDRQKLKKEAYADDLVDNLVVGTTRNTKSNGSVNDQNILGFTYAAFDPSLYANKKLTNNLKQLSGGCCCYCESYLEANNGGQVGHFRPVNLLDSASPDNNVSECSPYYELAYDQPNLIWSCAACDSEQKSGLFPLTGMRYPKVPLNAEQPLLINPYDEDPRQFIRFNPVNGRAYPWDQVLAFYRDTQQLSEQDTEKQIWENPANIPEQFSSDGKSISAPGTEQAFQQWREQISQLPERGQVSIEVLGLNRPALVMARLASLSSFKQMYSGLDASKKAEQPFKVEDIPVHEYRSLAVDAFNSWQYQQALMDQSDTNEQQQHKTPLIQHSPAQNQSVPSDSGQAIASLQSTIQAIQASRFSNKDFPDWFRSSVMYLVTQSQLENNQQRVLVMLHDKDALYGQQPKEECLLLPIDWHQDQNKIIKVKSFRNIWETSFAELSDSRPMELLNLFANNEIWVEGSFPPLSTHKL